MNELNENKELVLFENSKIRRQKYNDQWYYSIVDIVGILINQDDYETTRRYWNNLKVITISTSSVVPSFLFKVILSIIFSFTPYFFTKFI